MIGSFKLKVCLTLFSASAAYYKYAKKEKLESWKIGQIEVTPDSEEVLRTKICWKFFRKVTVLANGVKKSRTASIITFCSVFNLKSLSFPTLGKAKSNASLNNEAIF